jgi:hypothetical protein
MSVRLPTLRSLLRVVPIAAALSTSASLARAQTNGTCIPVAERGTNPLGCFITARQELGKLAGSPPLYWHVYNFPDRPSAERSKARWSTVVESYGRIWLFTIAAADWRPSSGTLVDRVGPLPIVAADSIAAVYMEGTFAPGMASVVHRHDGAEAWVTIEGSMCLETPNGTIRSSAGQPGILVRPHLPMVLTGTGTGVRKSVVLILQDATKPRSTPATDWKPRNLC